MKIQIIGLGVVGTAQAHLANRFGHDVTGSDPKMKDHPYCTVTEKYVNDADITFICTPEQVVENVVANLVDIKHKGLIVIKSTVPLGSTEKLSKIHNIHICHNPEFLRENHALDDVINPSRTVIGQCCEEHGQLLKDFYRDIESSLYITDSNTSELIKLVSNSFRAVTITFWNEIAILSKKLNIDVHKVSKICDQSKLIGEWEGGNWGTKFFMTPYDGKCLPKDIRHLISAFRAIGENPKLFDACEEFNNKLKKEFEKKKDDK